MKSKGKGFSLLSVIIIICVTSIISALTVGIIIINNYGLNYETLANDENLAEFLNTYSNIISNYYEEVDKEGMIDSAIDAMLEYLGDDYTTYLNTEESSELLEKLKGTYKGIGITVSKNEVIKVNKSGPAEKVGIKSGDIITKVNDTLITEDNISDVSALITSSEDTVTLQINRNGETLSFDVEITDVETPVNYEMIENTTIGYIDIDIFSRTLSNQVNYALEDLESQGMTKLIIDLRSNSGGYLESAELTADLFLEKDKLIYSLENKNGKEEYKATSSESTNYPIVVLIDNKTASSAEILACALKDSYGAILVGEKSYGKGKVQETETLSDGSIAKYTSAKWLRPSGECIDGVGITPDYEAKLTYEYDENGNETAVIDTQKSRAIEIISAM